eukprot:12403572-Karenia_brevis.AAC.1
MAALKLAISSTRLRTARALALRTIVHSFWSCRGSTSLGVELLRAAQALANALKVVIADGPQPPVGSPTMGTKDMPCKEQSRAVSR